MKKGDYRADDTVDIGKRFSYLVVLRVERVDGLRLYVCRCDCGREHKVTPAHLKAKRYPVRSCGCVGRRTHGHASRKLQSKTYECWCDMKKRCTNPSSIGYKNYGARGIVICERWMVFENFLADMGEVPVGFSLDRIDNDGNYEPGNCRWATLEQQRNNRQNTVYLVLNGESLPLTQWAKRFNIPAKTLYRRKILGWTDEDAITIPKGVRRGHAA